MKIICVDDNRIILSEMLSFIREIMPGAGVAGFGNTEDAAAYAEEDGCDVLFTEIELCGKPSGIALARRVQSINPRVNIIFTTVCSESEYAVEVMRIRPSGYLKKVVTEQDVSSSLSSLLYSPQ